jgi:hypothetical protein
MSSHFDVLAGIVCQLNRLRECIIGVRSQLWATVTAAFYARSRGVMPLKAHRHAPPRLPRPTSDARWRGSVNTLTDDADAQGRPPVVGQPVVGQSF